MFTIYQLIITAVIAFVAGMSAIVFAISMTNRNDPKMYTQAEWDSREEEYEENVDHLINQLTKARGKK